MKGTTKIAYDWAVRCFGWDHVQNRRMRALRLLEEAVELAQAVGVSREKCELTVDVVYGRAPGLPSQELGGVLLTATVLAGAFGEDPQDVLERELGRVLAKPVEHFTKRNDQKIALGLAVERAD
jgi:NTP pyrophosphatase (non-canonical NTP hydrolase)